MQRPLSAGEVSIVDLDAEYRRHMKRHLPLLKAARRDLTTLSQKQYLKTVAATAFAAGYRAGVLSKTEKPELPRKRLKPFTAKPWNPTNHDDNDE